MTDYELFRADPKAALDKELTAGEQSYFTCSHLYRSCDIVGGHTRAGSYRAVRRADLVGRAYEIEFVDGRVAIYFTDVLYDMKTFKHIPKEPQ